MSLQAETCRQRAQALQRQDAARDEPGVAAACAMARSCDVRARNEEWLEAELSPSEGSIQNAR
jgi:hypothetical protein